MDEKHWIIDIGKEVFYHEDTIHLKRELRSFSDVRKADVSR